MRTLLVLFLSLAANGVEPVVSAWIRSPTAAGAELRKVLPEVHDVVVDDDSVVTAGGMASNPLHVTIQ
jgi:hypothetical protein